MNEMYPIDRTKITLTKGDPRTDFWLYGDVKGHPGYSFAAKVFDVGSRYGIDGGRVSKLEVWFKDRAVLHYDRGWAVRPKTPKQEQVLTAIVGAFPDREKAIGRKDRETEKAKTRFQHSCKREFGRSR